MTEDKNTETGGRVTVSVFAAINPFPDRHEVKPDEHTMAGRNYVSWGKNNDYPDYLLGLRKTASTLKSVIGGCVDYTVGDKITCNALVDGRYMNHEKKTIRDIVRNLSQDWFTYGAFCFEVIRSNAGDIAEIYYVDVRYVRCNKECTVFYYSEDWAKRWGKKKDVVCPKFDPESLEVESSFVYVKNTDTQTYPECPFGGSVIAAELERDIDRYHLNSMYNGFSGSYIVNFNNGNPTDEIKDEIERQFNEKFSGFQNAGRVLFSWNEDREHQATVSELKSSDFSDRYEALAKRARQQIFTAFRANPNLFGIPTENLGFSDEEYDKAFRLFNRTVIQPVQRLIIDAFESVYPAGVRITPFTLDGDTENTETAEE